MANDGVKDGLKGARRRLSDTGAAALVFLLATAAGVALLAVPRPVPPTGTPGLRLDEDSVAAVLARDAELAARAPSGERARELRELYGEYSSAEARGGETQDSAQRLIRGLSGATAALRRDEGPDALAAHRAAQVTRLDAALGGELREEEEVRLLGTFRRVLERYGAAEDGEPTAPAFVVRTLFVARWNVAHGLPPTDGMEPVEQQAYWGWLALEAEGAPIDRRLAALTAYAAAGGARVAEARGTLLFRAGQMLPAAEAFHAAWEEEGTVRLRNHAMAASERAAGVP